MCVGRGAERMIHHTVQHIIWKMVLKDAKEASRVSKRLYQNQTASPQRPPHTPPAYSPPHSHTHTHPAAVLRSWRINWRQQPACQVPDNSPLFSALKPAPQLLHPENNEPVELVFARASRGTKGSSLSDLTRQSRHLYACAHT